MRPLKSPGGYNSREHFGIQTANYSSHESFDTARASSNDILFLCLSSFRLCTHLRPSVYIHIPAAAKITMSTALSAFAFIAALIASRARARRYTYIHTDPTRIDENFDAGPRQSF